MHRSLEKMEINIADNLLAPNKYSRPGMSEKRRGFLGLEIHYVQNPGTSAKANRNYFELRKGGKHSYGSAHYIIDLDGSIIRMIPDSEIAYSSGGTLYKPGIKEALGHPPYLSTVSIEFCHPQITGKPSRETYNSLVKLSGFLCLKYSWTSSNVYRHWDLSNDKKWGPTGKECPKFFVDFPTAWIRFKEDVDKIIRKQNDTKN